MRVAHPNAHSSPYPTPISAFAFAGVGVGLDGWGWWGGVGGGGVGGEQSERGEIVMVLWLESSGHFDVIWGCKQGNLSSGDSSTLYAHQKRMNKCSFTVT